MSIHTSRLRVDPPPADLEHQILTVRGRKVLLDADLSRLYGTTTKALNQAVKRNQRRFPKDFVFRSRLAEKQEVVTICDHLRALRFSTTRPLAFTELGAVMAANVLNSPHAIRMSVFVVRAFVRMRELLGTSRSLAAKLASLERELRTRLDLHETAIVDILQRVMCLLDPQAVPVPEGLGREIGFHVPRESLPTVAIDKSPSGTDPRATARARSQRASSAGPPARSRSRRSRRWSPRRCSPRVR